MNMCYKVIDVCERCGDELGISFAICVVPGTNDCEDVFDIDPVSYYYCPRCQYDDDSDTEEEEEEEEELEDEGYESDDS